MSALLHVAEEAAATSPSFMLQKEERLVVALQQPPCQAQPAASLTSCQHPPQHPGILHSATCPSLRVSVATAAATAWPP